MQIEPSLVTKSLSGEIFTKILHHSRKFISFKGKSGGDLCIQLYIYDKFNIGLFQVKYPKKFSCRKPKNWSFYSFWTTYTLYNAKLKYSQNIILLLWTGKNIQVEKMSFMKIASILLEILCSEETKRFPKATLSLFLEFNEVTLTCALSGIRL